MFYQTSSGALADTNPVTHPITNRILNAGINATALRQQSKQAQDGWRAAQDHRSNTCEIKQQIEKLSKKKEALLMQITIAKANAQANTVGINAMLKAHPETGHLRPSGAIWKSGETKTILDSLYDNAFDAYLEERNIKNPENHRKA